MHAHHRLIRNLVAQIRELQSENAALKEYLELQERVVDQAHRKVSQYQKDARYYYEQMLDYERRNSEAERLTQKLEQAKRYGNHYEVQRLSEKLKRTLRGW